MPPENELAERLGVSRTTVRSALQSLEQHGVLTRSPRRGTQVYAGLSPSMVILQRLIGFKRLLEESGHAVEVVTNAKVVTAAPAAVYEGLAEAPGTPLQEIDRLFLAGGKPAILALNYVRADLFPHEPSAEDLAQSPRAISSLLSGGPVDHSVVELIPRKATKEVVKKLGLKPSEPYLLLKELHLSDTGQILGFSLIHVNDHFVRFRLHRGAPWR